jgi:lipopolysaccharide transport system permease protein
MVALVDFLISFAILVALMIWYLFMPAGYVVPFIVQLGLVALVGCSASIVPDQWRRVYSLDRWSGVIDGENDLYLPGLWLSLAVTGFFVRLASRSSKQLCRSDLMRLCEL